MNWPAFHSIQNGNTQKAVCCLILVVSCTVCIICSLWIYRLYVSRIAFEKSKYIYINGSFAIILPFICILESSVSNIYLYFKMIPHRSYMKENIPVIYSVTTDSTLHFLFWF
eukprot:44030_1